MAKAASRLGERFELVGKIAERMPIEIITREPDPLCDVARARGADERFQSGTEGNMARA